MDTNVDATFDTLFITRELQEHGSEVGATEIHLFAYLACLLWVYRQRMPDDWGYLFVGTECGAPFSPAIDDAITALKTGGYLIGGGGQLTTRSGVGRRLADFEDLKLNRERRECLYAACSSVAALSLGMIGTALSQEPDLKRAQHLRVARRLLEGGATSQLYDHFRVIRGVLPAPNLDLRVPAAVWLAALYQSEESAAG